MPDITMCDNNQCLFRVKCYRFLATPSKYQSYIVWTNTKEIKICDYFWEV